MDRALSWFASAWVALAVLVNLVAILGLFIGAPTFWSGIGSVQHIYGLFNLANVVAEIVLLSPAIGALSWRDRRRKRAAARAGLPEEGAPVSLPALAAKPLPARMIDKEPGKPWTTAEWWGVVGGRPAWLAPFGGGCGGFGEGM